MRDWRCDEHVTEGTEAGSAKSGSTLATYANFLAAFSSSGFASGWYFLASLKYAFFRSFSVAPLGTPGFVGREVQGVSEESHEEPWLRPEGVEPDSAGMLPAQ